VKQADEQPELALITGQRLANTDLGIAENPNSSATGQNQINTACTPNCNRRNQTQWSRLA